jgi:hypothetical protein
MKAKSSKRESETKSEERMKGTRIERKTERYGARERERKQVRKRTNT